MSTGTIFLHKNIKTYLSHTKKVPLEVWRASHCPGVETYLDTEKNIVSKIVSFPSLNHSPFMLVVMLVVVLVVVLLSCCCCCLCLLCCRVANTAAAATNSTPPPPPLLLVSVKIDACYTNANSSPATLLHALCRAPTKGWWQGRGRGGGDRALGYNEGVGRYPIVWGAELFG